MDHIDLNSLAKGQHLILQLTDMSSYDCRYVEHSTTSMAVSDTHRHGSNMDPKSCEKEILYFLKHEIICITIAGELKTEVPRPIRKPIREPVRQIKMAKDEFKRHECMANDFFYIDPAGNTQQDWKDNKDYARAVTKLQHSENIAIEAYGTNFGRNGPIDILVMASWDAVYIFELRSFCLQRLPEALKDIIESERHRKVVHNAKPLYSCLKNWYKIKMENIFDTQVADVMVQKKEKETTEEPCRSILQCLEHYYNLNPNMFNSYKYEDIDEEMWKKRPLDEVIQCKCALYITYNISIMNELESLLLKNFYKATRTSIDMYSQAVEDLEYITFAFREDLNMIPKEVDALLTQQ